MNRTTDERGSTTGGLRAPRPLPRRLASLAWRLLVLAALGLLVLAGLGKLPSGTGAWTLAIRAATGAAVGVLVVSVVRRSMRSLVDPPPAPPAQVDASTVDVVYVCAVCGTRVRLEVAATGKAPRHCGEEMEARLAE